MKPRLEAMLAAFRQRYEQSVPFQEDRALAADLAEQARPAFEALSEPRPDAGADPDHEAMALLTLLSRRAGLRGATPSAAFALCRAIEAGLQAGASPLEARAREHLSLVVLEGYVAGRDERVTKDGRRAAVAGLGLTMVAPQAFALVAAGRFEADELGSRLEELERELLRADARCLVLDVTRLDAASDEVPRLFCGVLATARSLGVKAFLCGFEGHDEAPWVAAGFERLGVERTASFADALTRALGCVDLELKPRRRWSSPLFRRRSTDREGDPA